MIALSLETVDLSNIYEEMPARFFLKRKYIFFCNSSHKKAAIILHHNFHVKVNANKGTW